MRRAPSATEALLWRLLRNRQLTGMKFRRQVPVGRYIADFLCVDRALIVEADGPFHEPDEDAIRDRWLAAEGLRVLRFTNSQVHTDRENVLNAIIAAAKQQPPRLPY